MHWEIFSWNAAAPSLVLQFNNNITDSSANNATWTPTDITYSKWVLGSHCATFNWSSSFISFPDLAAYNVTTGTLHCRIKSSYIANYQYIAAKNGNTTNTDNFYWWIWVSITWVPTYYSGARRNANTDVCDSKWHHIALVWTPSSWTFYLDGAVDWTHAFTPFLKTSSVWLLRVWQRLWDTSRNFNWDMDAFIFEPTALSASEIRKIYNAWKWRYNG